METLHARNDQTNFNERSNDQKDATDHAEGKVAKAIEQQTAKLPSDVFLWAAGASVLGSLALQISGLKQKSLFVGQWVPFFLLLGIYNKIVKVAGSDRIDAR